MSRHRSCCAGRASRLRSGSYPPNPRDRAGRSWLATATGPVQDRWSATIRLRRPCEIAVARTADRQEHTAPTVDRARCTTPRHPARRGSNEAGPRRCAARRRSPGGRPSRHPQSATIPQASQHTGWSRPGRPPQTASTRSPRAAPPVATRSSPLRREAAGSAAAIKTAPMQKTAPPTVRTGGIDVAKAFLRTICSLDHHRSGVGGSFGTRTFQKSTGTHSGAGATLTEVGCGLRARQLGGRATESSYTPGTRLSKRYCPVLPE